MRLTCLGEGRPARSAAQAQRRFVDLELAIWPRRIGSSSRPCSSVPTEVGGDLPERPADAALAHAGDHRALVLQQIFGDIPAAIDGADHMGFRHPHIVEEGLADGE